MPERIDQAAASLCAFARTHARAGSRRSASLRRPGLQKSEQRRAAAIHGSQLRQDTGHALRHQLVPGHFPRVAIVCRRRVTLRVGLVFTHR
jgi:hypothetical protein